MKRAFPLFLTILIIVSNAHATEVSGSISENTVWTADNSPYYVTGTIYVDNWITLTIEPGVDVVFDADVSLEVRGKLIAVGTETDSIRFLPNTAIGNTEWGGLRIIGRAAGTSSFAYVRISGGDADDSSTQPSGGALFAGGTDTLVIDMRNSVISDNRASSDGGGIYLVSSARGVFVDTRFENNHAVTNGGAVRLLNGAVAEFIRCEMIGNTATTGGAIMTQSGFGMTDSRIERNASTMTGGAISAGNTVSPITISRSVIAFNTSGHNGAALTISSGPIVYLTQTTIYGNVSSAEVNGGAISCIGTNQPHINSSIIAANTPTDFFTGLGTPVVHYSITQAEYEGTENLVANPMLVDPENGDFRLMPGSPAIDAGDPTLEPDDNGSRADIGAFTVQPPLLGDVSGNGEVTAADASIILQYVARIVDGIDVDVADVSGNGTVSAYDASFVLARAVNPGFAFPAEIPNYSKPSASIARSLSWQSRPDGYSLVVDNPAGIVAAEFTVALEGADAAEVYPHENAAWRRDGETLNVALVHMSDSAELLRLVGVESGTTPRILSLSLNEGTIPTVVANPFAFELHQNAPNPFNPQTTLRFGLPASGPVSLVIYDVNGRLVRTLVDGNRAAGMHEVVWDARDDAGRAVASGVYVYRLTNQREAMVRRMVLVR